MGVIVGLRDEVAIATHAFEPPNAQLPEGLQRLSKNTLDKAADT